MTLFLLLTLIRCDRATVTRDQWIRMSDQDKDLVVQSMAGGEKAQDAKGGTGSRYTKPTAHYRQEIDKRYAAGDQRSVNEIWDELRD